MTNYIILFVLVAAVVLGICCVIGPVAQADNTGNSVGNPQNATENIQESIENTKEALKDAPTLEELKGAGAEAIGILDQLMD